jgi:uncharacterized membrane-anchored protein YhcB (DUF1043 family)
MIALGLLLGVSVGTLLGWFLARGHASAQNDDLQEEIRELQEELDKAKDPTSVWEKLVKLSDRE